MKLSEDQLIAWVLEACPHPLSPWGPGDDGALLAPVKVARALTSDLLIEGTHFYRAHPPEALGFKALAVNVSDVAAMGAHSEAFTLSVAVPNDLPPLWWRHFCAGLGACAREAKVQLVGGDTVSSRGPLTISITAWGAREGEGLQRDRAQPGDDIWVAGVVGRSGLGWERWQELQQTHKLTSWEDGLSWDGRELDPCVQHHLKPKVDVGLGPRLAQLGVRVGMDLSDGLATDAPRLAKASQVELDIDLAALPADAALDGMSAVERARHGEDYGLLVTAPPHLGATLEALGLTRIGKVRLAQAQGRVIWRLGERPLTELSAAFAHF